jgi:hypothetical protein
MIFVCVISQKGKQKPKNILYDPKRKTFHHAWKSNMSLLSSEKLPPMAKADVTAAENFVTDLIKTLKAGKEFPKHLLVPLPKDTPVYVQSKHAPLAAGNLL